MNIRKSVIQVIILITAIYYSNAGTLMADNTRVYKYNRNSKITTYELYEIPMAELRLNADTKFILNIITILEPKAVYEGKALNRLFDILIYCGDGIIAEDLSNRLYKILVKSQSLFFTTIGKINSTNQQYIYALLFNNPNICFRINLIKHNSNSDFMFKLYNRWKSGNDIFVSPVRK